MDLRKVLEEQILDEISREGLLAARIRQLERRSEDVGRKRKKCELTTKPGGQNESVRLQPRKIEEGDLVLVFTISTGQRTNSQYHGSGHKV